MRSQSLTLEHDHRREDSSRHLLSREDLSRIRLGRSDVSEQVQLPTPKTSQHRSKAINHKRSFQRSIDTESVAHKKRKAPLGAVVGRIRDQGRYQIHKPRVGNFLTRKLLGYNRLVWVLIVAMILFGATATWMSYAAVKGITTPLGSFSSGQSNGGATPADGELEESQPDISNYSVKANMPKIISIPSINSKGRVLHLGTNSSNKMAVPGNVHDTSWYNGSAVPGSGSGAAVIAGHKSGPRVPGVFMNLSKLGTGAEINVELGDGRIIKYSVVSSEKIPNEKVDMLKALTPIAPGKEGLTLITCGGNFNPSTQTYDSRDIVYATRVN